MKVAMKAKDTIRVNTIRLIRSAFANAAIEARTEQLSDDQVWNYNNISENQTLQKTQTRMWIFCDHVSILSPCYTYIILKQN